MDPNHLIKVIDEGYKRRVKHFDLETKTYDIVMIGDSMIAYMNIKKYFPNQSVMNQGIAGDTTEGLLNRLTYVKRVKPKKIIISIGSNDLVLLNKEPIDIAKSIEIIYVKLKEDNPNTNVFLCNITPINDQLEISNKTYIFNRKNEDIDKINKNLENRFSKKIIIDVYSSLIDSNNQLEEAYTTDGIHLNEKGYDIFTTTLKEKMKSR